MFKLLRSIIAFCTMLALSLLCFGVTIAQESESQPITVDNASSVAQIATLEGHEGAVNSVTFSPDGTLLATGGDDGIVRVWNLETGEEPVLFEGNTGPVNALAFSPDGTLLASGGDMPNIQLLIWNVETGEEMARFEHPDVGLIVDFINNGRPVKIFDVEFRPDGSLVFAVGALQAFIIWNVDSNQFSAQEEWAMGAPTVLSISYSADGTFVATGRSDGLLLTPLDEEGNMIGDEPIQLNCHDDTVSTVAFSPDTAMLASGSFDDTICLWNIDAENTENVAVLEGHTNVVTGVAFNSDGTLLVSGSLDGTLRLWDVATQEELASLSAAEDVEIYTVAFSPDGTLIASAGSDGIVTLWGIEE